MKILVKLASFAAFAVLLSCTGASPKEGGNVKTDDFLAQAEKDIRAISNGEDFMAYYKDFEQKKSQYEGSDDRLAAFNEVEDSKFVEFYEPVMNRLEDAIAVMNAKWMKGEAVADEDKAELDAAIQEIDKYEDYANLQPDYQFRYNRIVEGVAYLILKGVVEY